MGGTCGYDPLHQVRIENGKPNQQDIIAIASAICPKEAQQSDPFWGLAAANYLSSYIAYVFEGIARTRVDHGFGYQAIRKWQRQNPAPL